MKNLNPGDIVRVDSATTAHSLQEHRSCDSRCVDIPDSHLALVVSQPFHPDIEFEEDPPYMEVTVVGPLGLVSMDCEYCWLLSEAPAPAPSSEDEKSEHREGPAQPQESPPNRCQCSDCAAPRHT